MQPAVVFLVSSVKTTVREEGAKPRPEFTPALVPAFLESCCIDAARLAVNGLRVQDNCLSCHICTTRGCVSSVAHDRTHPSLVLIDHMYE